MARVTVSDTVEDQRVLVRTQAAFARDNRCADGKNLVRKTGVPLRANSVNVAADVRRLIFLQCGKFAMAFAKTCASLSAAARVCFCSCSNARIFPGDFNSANASLR